MIRKEPRQRLNVTFTMKHCVVNRANQSWNSFSLPKREDERRGSFQATEALPTLQLVVRQTKVEFGRASSEQKDAFTHPTKKKRKRGKPSLGTKKPLLNKCSQSHDARYTLDREGRRRCVNRSSLQLSLSIFFSAKIGKC